ncbi:MAG TPA: hypothetical protein VJ964_04855 [Balneolaceae bacterium]|nr:hypothetical protein [Balneolaceae bacterium]
MPAQSRWMIRCSLIYLLVGFVIGALLLSAKTYPALSQLWILLPVHIEILIFGFIIQFTLGTAYWILPRFIKGKPRGNSGIAKLVVGSLNAGIFLNIMTFLNILPVQATILGRSLEGAAVALFVTLHWSRVVSYRN